MKGRLSMPKTRIKVVDDVEYVEAIRQKLKDNEGFCPCRLVKNEDTKCMCKEFREQADGVCHCGLYVKEIIEEGNDN